MTAPYDTYDYPSYWSGRDYEHKSEVTALKDLLIKIPRLKTSLEIGCGFGRLLPTYIFRSKRVILTDPSVKLLRLANKKYGKNKKVKFVHCKLENLIKKVKPRSVDLVVMVRVLHHIEDIDKAFTIIDRLLCQNGYFILEFANKGHLKATLREFVKGNLTFPLDLTPKDLRSKRSLKNNSLPFINWHTDLIKHKLEEMGFTILETRSVSNFRNSFLKAILPPETIDYLEKHLQKPLARLNFGPSIFILSQKQR